jgi:hypothetical protein
MAILPELFDEINSCETLYLREITEPEENCLRLLIEEATSSSVPVPIKIGGTDLGRGFPVRSTCDSRLFEITWRNYVAYSLRNESYAGSDEYETIEWGKRVRVFSRSHFLDYVSHATFAGPEYPGPFQHMSIGCEMHIIDIVSHISPTIRRLRPIDTFGGIAQ